MREHHQQEDGWSARIRVDRPVSRNAVAAVVMAQSGRMGPYDQVGYEAELYERLAGRFVAQGLVAIRFDAERDRPKTSPSTDLRLAERARRLAEVVVEASHATATNRILLLGASLGALAIADILARPGLPLIAGAILIGCVLETPCIVMPPLGRLELVYGASDLVAYVDEKGACTQPVMPSQYSRHTADNLIVLPSTQVGIHIVEGVGHLLERPGAASPTDDVLDLLSNLTCGLVRNHPVAQRRYT